MFGKTLLWVSGYFCIILLYTAIDVLIWRKINSPISAWLNISTMCIVSGVYIRLWAARNLYQLNIWGNVSFVGIFLAILCSIVFFLLFDKCLDPFFERLFSTSEEAYQKSILTLSKAPIAAFVRVCILAPVIEEIIMRGFVLGGLKDTSGSVIALLISAAIFALFHFNMPQTVSGLIAGLVLGVLYLKTGSLLCCMVAHCGYNAISYFTTIYPLIGKGHL